MSVPNESARYGSEPTPRELEVLRVWMDCRSQNRSRCVATFLGISVHGVNHHLANARARAGVYRTWEAALLFLGKAA